MSSSNGMSGGGRIWTVVCAVATVVLGPAAVTASALDQANAAPLHHAATTDRTHAYIPSERSGQSGQSAQNRRRAAA